MVVFQTLNAGLTGKNDVRSMRADDLVCGGRGIMRSGGLGYENCIQTVDMLLLCDICGGMYGVCVGGYSVCGKRRRSTQRTDRGTKR